MKVLLHSDMYYNSDFVKKCIKCGCRCLIGIEDIKSSKKFLNKKNHHFYWNCPDCDKRNFLIDYDVVETIRRIRDRKKGIYTIWI